MGKGRNIESTLHVMRRLRTLKRSPSRMQCEKRKRKTENGISKIIVEEIYCLAQEK